LCGSCLLARASPWPKFDKAVSELHVWLDDVTDMMKAEKVVLSDSEEIFALAEKQKVTVTCKSIERRSITGGIA